MRGAHSTLEVTQHDPNDKQLVTDAESTTLDTHKELQCEPFSESLPEACEPSEFNGLSKIILSPIKKLPKIMISRRYRWIVGILAIVIVGVTVGGSAGGVVHHRRSASIKVPSSMDRPYLM